MWRVYFDLTKPLPPEANSEINGMKVHIEKGNSKLIVEFADASDDANAQQKALSAANSFLDTLCWKCGTCLGIDPDSQDVEYISSTSKSITITPAPALAVATTSQPTVVKKDSSGNVIEVSDPSRPGKIEVKPSEAASYYRHAHLSDDLFNRFHDLYLAAENVASKIQVAKELSKNKVKQLSGSGKSYEEGSLKLALDECFASNPLPLKQVAKTLPEFGEAREAIPQVAKILYKEYRCELNHSKASENKKIPFNPEDEKEVKAALPLMEFVAKSLLQYEANSLL